MRRAFDHERMIARRLERPVDAAKHAGAFMTDIGHLAVDRHGRAHDLAAEHLADGLMAKAHAHDRDRRRGLFDQFEADAGFVRRAGAGRQHDGVRARCDDVGRRHLVVAMHDNIRSQPAEIMDEVEREAVVVIDQDDHDAPFAARFCCRFRVLDGGSEGVKGAAGKDGYWPRPALDAKRRASSAARNNALALLMHSVCSEAGSLSATMPAPA